MLERYTGRLSYLTPRILEFKLAAYYKYGTVGKANKCECENTICYLGREYFKTLRILSQWKLKNDPPS